MWYLIVSIPDLCTLTYFYSVNDFKKEKIRNFKVPTKGPFVSTDRWKGVGGGVGGWMDGTCR